MLGSSNQRCADCAAPLSVAGKDQAHVVLPFGTFVCQVTRRIPESDTLPFTLGFF
jgi:hypothetical protein